MLIIRGVNVYPSQIEEVLASMPDLSPYFRIVVSRDQHLDHIEVHCEVSPAWAVASGFSALPASAVEAHDARDAHEASLALRAGVVARLHETLGVSVLVRLLGVGEGPRSDGAKVQRVVDRRSKSV
jgi:phenylacetate-CoA ligase